jgi:hypothetical protein
MLLKLPGDLDRTRRAAIDALDAHYSRFLLEHLHTTLVGLVRGEPPAGLLERELQRAELAALLEAATSANQIRAIMARAKIPFGAMNHHGADS